MTPLETVNEFIRRVVAGDVDSACELVTDDVEYDNVPMGKNHGPEGIKAFLGAMGSGPVENIEFIIHRETATGNIVMNERTDRFVIGGTNYDLLVAGVFEVTNDGKISLWRDYFDMAVVNDLMAALAG